MVDWIILVFGVLLLAAGLWQYRTPEETQELALRDAKRPWQRKLFASDQYHGLVGLNGLFLLIIGAALLLYAASSLLLGAFWPSP